MYDLKQIIERNRAAVQCGVALPGTLIGTASTEPVGIAYPWTVQPTVSDEGTTRYVVRNYATGFESAFSHAAYEAAEGEARQLIAGEPL